jgi:hypothetical protein
MSDIWIKTTNTGSTRWRKALSIKMKRFSSTWVAAKVIWIKNTSSGWLRVWPTSGVFAETDPYITTTSSGSTPLYSTDNVIRIGTTYYGRNGTWNPNGFTISSYTYTWQYYSEAANQPGDYDLLGNLGTGVYSSPSQALNISTSTNATATDNKYISFKITANASNALYSNTADSKDTYGKIKVIRRSPINISFSIGGDVQVGSTLSVSSAWNTTEARKPDAFRTTIQWYKNLSNSTTGGTLVSSGSYSYTIQSSDLNHYIYAVETTFNSGSDYDLGLGVGVEAKAITTSTVTAGLTPPTSVSVASVSRYSDTETLVTLSHSGGSGPYYQLYWTGTQTLPVTPNYDAASNTSSSSISEAFAFANNITYYFWVRSSSENIPTTFDFGTGTSGTYSAYSDITPRPFYTFQSPSGATSSITGSTTTGSTLTLTANSPTTASPSATTTSISWRVNDGGTGGNSFTGGSVLQSGGTTFVIPQFLYGSVSSVGYQVRAEVTWNNGVGSQTANSNAITITAPLTKLATPTGVNASDNRSDGVNVTWNSVSGAAYYGVWYGPTPGYDSLADFGGNRNTSLITGTSYLDDSIGTGVTRDYYVQAYRSGDPTGTKSDWGGPNAGTRVAAAAPPTGGSVSVNPTSGTAGSTTYTASASGWSGTGTISYSFSWQYFSSSSFSYVQVATGSTFSPASNVNTLYPNFGWQVVVTASNGVSPNGTASTSFTINSPAAPATPAITSGPSISWGSGNNFTLSATASNATNIEFQVQFANTNGGTVQNTVTYFMGASAGSRTTGAQSYPWARTRARANNTSTGLSSSFTAYTGWA